MKLRSPLFEAVGEGGSPSLGQPIIPPVAPVATPVVAPVVAAPLPGTPPDPAWLNPRLDAAGKAAQSALLAQLGVASLEDAQAKLKAAKDLEDANKTEAEKTAARLLALETEATQGKAALIAVKAYADAAIAGLTEPQRAAVKAIAGEDSTKVLGAIEALRPTWAAASAPVPPAAANTAPPANAPAGTTPASPPDRKAQYAELKKTNPVAAAALLRAHHSEIYPHA